MMPHRIDTAAIRTRRCRAFASAWDGWRGGQMVPSRADMRIDQISGLLPMLTIVELSAPETIAIRLAGTAIADATGLELTGKNYLELASPNVRPYRHARAKRVAHHPCGALLHNVRDSVDDDRKIQLEMLTLPVRPSDADGPMQLVTLAVPVASEHLMREHFSAEIGKAADSFTFIDIGAGIPVDPRLEAQAPQVLSA